MKQLLSCLDSKDIYLPSTRAQFQRERERERERHMHREKQIGTDARVKQARPDAPRGKVRGRYTERDG